MFKRLLATTALCLIGSTASAEMAFSHGDITAGAYGFSAEPGVYLFDLTARGAWDTGSLGVQLDATYSAITDFTNSLGFGMAGAHLYLPSAGGHKYGAYASADAIAGNVFYGAGAEAMFGFASLDLEVAAGAIFNLGTAVIGDVSATAFYQISPQFEVSAGIRSLFYSSDSINAATLGASYDFPASNFAVNGYASTAFGGGGTVYGLQVTYALGDTGGNRLFSPRGLNLLKTFNP